MRCRHGRYIRDNSADKTTGCNAKKCSRAPKQQAIGAKARCWLRLAAETAASSRQPDAGGSGSRRDCTHFVTHDPRERSQTLQRPSPAMRSTIVEYLLWACWHTVQQPISTAWSDAPVVQPTFLRLWQGSRTRDWTMYSTNDTTFCATTTSEPYNFTNRLLATSISSYRSKANADSDRP